MSSQIHQNYSAEGEAPSAARSPHICGPPTPSLGFYFHGDTVTLECVSHFFHELAKEKCQGTQGLLKMQNEGSGHIHFQDMQRPPQNEWGDTRDAMEATVVLEKNLTGALLDL